VHRLMRKPIRRKTRLCRPVAQLSRLPGAQHLAQHQADVECADMNQQALENILPSVQGAASHSAGLVAMSKGSFDELASSPQQLLPYLPRTR
jgi:hypothetical protein